MAKGCTDFKEFKVGDFLRSWEACIKVISKYKRSVHKWEAPLDGWVKFNVVVAIRGKLGPAGMGVILHVHLGVKMFFWGLLR